MSSKTKSHKHPPSRRLREGLDLSLDETGRRARIERSRLSRYERGYANLHADERGRLATVLGVTIAVLDATTAASPTGGG